MSEIITKNPVNVAKPNAISYAVTWVDGRIIFKHNKKYSDFYYGLCSFSMSVFAVTPLDYERATMITSINVSPFEKYCERAFSCLNFKCKLNQFDKNVFISEFKDCGPFTLGLPQDIGSKPLWFSEGEYTDYWQGFIIPVDGGTLSYDEYGGGKKILQL